MPHLCCPFADRHRQGRQRPRAATAMAPSTRLGQTSAQLARRISAAVLGGRSTSAPPTASRCTFDAAARAAAEVPAVGSYDVVSVGAISSNLQRRLAENRCSPMFAQPLVPSRWPAPVGRHQQGQQPAALQQAAQLQQSRSAAGKQLGRCPHHSHDAGARHVPPDQTSSRMPGVSAPFRSTSPSHPAGVQSASDAALAGAPGPAFYRPGLLPAKKSHRRATSPEVAAAILAAV
jgi:hypothetical protein